ncbi:uncharacterized protein LOC132948155 [Metopolophium dirhodum]|uniref:uncharacterized protein LOC132948155 n=1 Tax=Metopolophium dirhodum TaxID=44670 RepID=UPI00298FA238|nr:uncharacterized protein LOC132948155 [Metopolophium dirhodum]
MTLEILAQEKVWLNKSYYADAERVYFEKQTKILNYETFGKYINDQVKPRNNTNCEDCSMCNTITQIHLHNDISKLLDNVEQWDKIDSKMNLNQYKQINKFECLVCFFKTFKFNDWKCHIMSLPHMANCHKIKNLYSYVCCEKICKLLLYGPKELLIKHNMDQHLYNGDVFSMSTLMAEVMKRYLADNLKPLYFCSHCKNFAETPIHTDVKLLNNAIKIPIEYYCRFCRVTFLSSHEMIDYHLLSLEHTTLKCFDELCSKTKINSKKIKLSEELNQNNESNLSDVQNVLTNNSLKLPNIILTRFQNISQYRGLCKLCGASLIWNSKIIVSHLLECKYTYDFTKSNKTTVKTFDCGVCNQSTNSMNQHILHIISHSHLSNCYDTNNYYSYFCNECNRYMYSYRFAILNHITLCHKNMKTIVFPIFSIFMANIFKEFNKNANRVEFIHYHSTDKPIKCSKTESFKCRKCKIKFETLSDYNWHLVTSEHIILSFVIPKAVKNNNKKRKRKRNKNKKEKIKNVSTTNHTEHVVIQTIEPSIIQNVPISQKYDEIKSKSDQTQNVQLNKSPINLDIDGRTILDNIQTVQKSLVNNNILEKLNDDVQKGSNKSNENRKLMIPNHIKQWQQYTNYFKHKMSLLKKLRQYEDLVTTTLSYYCDVCDFIAVEKYNWDKHNQTEHPLDSNRPITYCSTCFMFVVGGEHNRTIEHSTLLNFLQSLKPVEVLMEKTSLVKLVESCSSDKNCLNLKPKEKNGLNNTDCAKESKYSKDIDSKNSDCFLMKEPSTSREDPMMKNTILLLDKTESQHEHKNDKTNASNAAKLIHSEITSSNNLANTLMTIPHQSNALVEKMTENINFVNVSTNDLVFNQVENDSEFIEIVKSQNFDGTNLPPKTNKTQIFKIKKLCELDGDQLYGEYVTQRLKNIKSTTIKQHVKLEIDYIFYTKMKQLSQENTEP